MTDSAGSFSAPELFDPADKPVPLLSVAELRACEARAQAALAPHTLMARAGAAAARLLLDELLALPCGAPPSADAPRPSLPLSPLPVWIAAGPGNNGGDALVLATQLHRAGVAVQVCMPVEVKPDDARWALASARAAGVPVSSNVPADADALDAYGWVVDGLFGIGLTRALEGVFATLARIMSARARRRGCVLALDVPSGLDSDTGNVVGNEVNDASETAGAGSGKVNDACDTASGKANETGNGIGNKINETGGAVNNEVNETGGVTRGKINKTETGHTDNGEINDARNATSRGISETIGMGGNGAGEADHGVSGEMSKARHDASDAAGVKPLPDPNPSSPASIPASASGPVSALRPFLTPASGSAPGPMPETNPATRAGPASNRSLAVRATHTITFIAAKPGLFTANGRDHAAQVRIAPIGIDARAFAPHAARLNAPALFARALPARAFATHKGTFGTLAVIGGDTGMCGAPILAARAALYAGAGKVHAGFVGRTAPLYDALHPELMLHAASELPLASIDAFAIGCGMGTGENARRLLARVLQLDAPTLLDADALNLLARDPALAARVAATANTGSAHRTNDAAMAGVSDAQRANDLAAENANAVYRTDNAATANANDVQRVNDIAVANANAVHHTDDTSTANASDTQCTNDVAAANANAVHRTNDTPTVNASAAQCANDMAATNANAVHHTNDTPTANANDAQRANYIAATSANAIHRTNGATAVNASAAQRTNDIAAANANAVHRTSDAITANASGAQCANDIAATNANTVHHTNDTPTANAGAVQCANDIATANANAVYHTNDATTANASDTHHANDIATTNANAIHRTNDVTTANASAAQYANDMAATNANAIHRTNDTTTINAGAAQRANHTATASASDAHDPGRTPTAVAIAPNHARYVLTPHPLEAARMLGVDTRTIQRDRLAAARTLAARFASVVVLKGSGTVIASPDGRLAVNPTGNAGLASGGTGDVLGGLIGALLAQRLPPFEAALAGVYLHGLAADTLSADGDGPVGLNASELAPRVRRLLNQRFYR